MQKEGVKIEFDGGTIVVHADETSTLPLPKAFVFDRRVNAWRGEAFDYAELIMALHSNHLPYQDNARNYSVLTLRRQGGFQPRDYQLLALQAWIKADRRGVVVLPTGTGKSLVAQIAMENCQRSTLVVVPTLDLVEQWVNQLTKAFGVHVGMLGGGSKDIADITVSTYDSAVLMMEYIGNRFGLLIADECHHLPGPTYRLLSRFCLAPFRLGLTATPERADGGEDYYDDLIGQICFRKNIDELEGRALAPYRTERIAVELYEDEFNLYQFHRQRYVDFIHANRINLSSRDGWGAFLRATVQRHGGREAFESYLEQRRLARTCRAKFEVIWQLIQRHLDERILLFTADNPTAYEIGQRFCLPVLTHYTKLAERRELLDAFRSGRLPYLVTSKVLNEGVDVPEASVGIVVSGSGSIREHVQRLGRILRKADGKQAVLYELVSMGTSELNTSERRRQHRAYERPDSM
ncbi:MAG: DEAD/DEAH box helicase family protein [Victivallales bacterium]|nr:DEAD/DEAH box helicase family protein [Victivallales bacterium]